MKNRGGASCRDMYFFLAPPARSSNTFGKASCRFPTCGGSTFLQTSVRLLAGETLPSVFVHTLFIVCTNARRVTKGKWRVE